MWMAAIGLTSSSRTTLDPTDAHVAVANIPTPEQPKLRKE